MKAQLKTYGMQQSKKKVYGNMILPQETSNRQPKFIPKETEKEEQNQ